MATGCGDGDGVHNEIRAGSTKIINSESGSCPRALFGSAWTNWKFVKHTTRRFRPHAWRGGFVVRFELTWLAR